MMTIDAFLAEVEDIATEDASETRAGVARWYVGGSANMIRHGCDCPILAVARHLGVDEVQEKDVTYFADNSNAREFGLAIGLAGDDITNIIKAADGMVSNNPRVHEIRGLLLDSAGLTIRDY